MKQLLSKAKTILTEGDYTCVLYDGSATLTASQRGVQPLRAWLDSQQNLSNFVAADRVVGKAAAYLYVLLGIKAVYAGVVSHPAIAVFERFGIDLEYGTAVTAIQNRTKDGFCPMERAVWDIDDPYEAAAAIERTVARLNAQKNTNKA